MSAISGKVKLQGKSVLVIEDDFVLLKSMAEAFSRAGAVVAVAPDGALGMQQFTKSRPDLVVTDIIMPDKEGIETIAEMRAFAPALPILAISGGGRVKAGEFLSLARSLGATDVMAKPFRTQDLLDKAAELLPASSEQS